MNQDVFKEKSPLTPKDSFVLFERVKQTFAFPVHIHEEYELNFIECAEGAMRIVGTSIETIKDKDLVLICNPSLKHAWQDGKCKSDKIHEITIQFSSSLFSSDLFQKKQFESISHMLIKAQKGILFSDETINKVMPFLRTLTTEKDGFYSVMKFFMILYELSLDDHYRLLSSGSVLNADDVNKVFKLQEFIKMNLSQSISLDAAANYLGMSKATFSRFVKKNIGINFSAYLLHYRIDSVIQAMNNKDMKGSIEEIADRYGFESPSYFYKVFKQKTGMTPLEYQKNRKKNLLII